MRNLSCLESSIVSGGDYLDQNTNYDIFWKSFAAASGAGSGYICSIPMAVIMCVYGVAYYGIYTPVYYVVAGVYNVASATVNGAYSAGYSAGKYVTGY